VDDPLDVGLVTEKPNAVRLLGISGHQREVIEEINASHPRTEVGNRLLLRGKALIMEVFDDNEA